MPEGPEIRRSADQLARALARRRVSEIYFAFEHLKPFERTLTGSTVTSVSSRGKAMLVRFSGGRTVYSHNQLYGRWYVRDSGRAPDTKRQLRLAIHNSRQSAFLYSASDIAVLDTQELHDHPFLSTLGPDLLDNRVGAAQIVRRLMDFRFERRGLASLLLDQKFLAGTGNYLRSEILYQARLAPTHKPVDLDTHQLGALAEASLNTTRRSYTTGGLTNAPQFVARLKRQGVARSGYRHFVFGREGEPCHVCKRVIVRANFSGRRLYWCPECQQ